MTKFTRDPEFVDAIREIFGENAEKMLAKENVVLQLEEIWLRAMWRERKRVYDYLSDDDVQKSFDQGGLTLQLRHIIGNGTYLDEEPSLLVRPPWLGENKMSLENIAPNRWEIRVNDERILATLTRETFVANKQRYVGCLLDEGGEEVAKKVFWEHASALEWLEEAARMMGKAMGIPLYTREHSAGTWAVEDMEMRPLGLVQRLDGIDGGSFVVILDGEAQDQSQFPTFDEALQWLRFRSSEVQSDSEGSKRTA